MNAFCKALFYATVLLMVSKAATDVLALQKSGVLSYTSISADWAEEPGEEEDNLEVDDDEATSPDTFLIALHFTKTSGSSAGEFSLKDFISEVVPPPPQA